MLEATTAGVAITNNQYVDMCSVALTKGLWLVSSIVTVSGASLVGTRILTGISTSSGNAFADLSTQAGNATDSPTIPTNAANESFTIANYKVYLSADTTYYLKCYVAFSSGSGSCIGRITAVRIA